MQVKLVDGCAHYKLTKFELRTLRDAEALCRALEGHGEACSDASFALSLVRNAFDPSGSPTKPVDATEQPAAKDTK